MISSFLATLTIIDGFVKSLIGRHPGESRGPDVVPAEAGNQTKENPDSDESRNDEKE